MLGLIKKIMKKKQQNKIHFIMKQGNQKIYQFEQIKAYLKNKF